MFSGSGLEPLKPKNQTAKPATATTALATRTCSRAVL
jgi:hypothetical protein